MEAVESSCFSPEVFKKKHMFEKHMFDMLTTMETNRPHKLKCIHKILCIICLVAEQKGVLRLDRACLGKTPATKLFV